MTFRIIAFAFFVVTTSHNLVAQYFQQDVAYEINASIDTNHLITATCDIAYTNNSNQTLDTIYIHLWANAFQDRLSQYSEQALRLGNLDYYFADDRELGGYEGLTVRMNGSPMQLYSKDGNKDVVYFLPPKGITPNTQLELACAYQLQLPRKFSRLGWKTYDQFLTYWYPSIATYDDRGWHPMPYLDMGETYMEVANYKVILDGGFEHLISSTPATKQGSTSVFEATQLNDFAIITSKNKPVYTYDLTIKENALRIEVMSKDQARADSIYSYIKAALPYFEEKIGAFPYASLSVFDQGPNASGGMEYPGLITVSGEDQENSKLRYYVIHELLHQYFYGALTFNQRDHAWLDEGLTTHYQQRYYREVFGLDQYSAGSDRFTGDNPQPLLQTSVRAQACRHYHAPIATPSNEVEPMNYGFNAYEIPARMYTYLTSYLGADVWDEHMQTFYTDWTKKHPSPSDFQSSLESKTGKDLSWFFGQLIQEDWAYDYAISDLTDGKLTVDHKLGSTPPYPILLQSDNGQQKTIWTKGHLGRSTIDVGSQWTKATLDHKKLSMDIDRNNNYAGIRRPIKPQLLTSIDNGATREINFLPTLAYNTSDGGMVGLALYNSSFPPKRLKWLVSPAYGLSSGKVVGEGWVSYDQFLDHPRLFKLTYGVNAKSYAFQNSESLAKTLSYMRISPSAKLAFRHDQAKQIRSSITFQPVFLQEEAFRFEGENEVFIDNNNSLLWRLRYQYENSWKLSPTSIYAQLEQQSYKNVVGENHNYLKLTASLSKSYHYAPTQKINFRLWGSYFLLNTQRQSSNYDGAIAKGSNALIYQGFNDYAYDHYFFNRSNQGVTFDNQVSNAGGGFKTSLGSQYNVGQSNDLALALNISSDLPIKMPKFLPLKLFLDIGYVTTKGTSTDELSGTTIYSGGVMLSYFDDSFSIHLPLFNSSAISEIYDTEGLSLLGKISFKLDLQKNNPWNLIDEYRY